MSPDQWRAVETVLQGALGCEPSVRDRFVSDACGDDEVLRREVSSLLAAHDRAEDFLERSAPEALGLLTALPPLSERLAIALAGRYQIERELAQGGMATVYLARDLRHERPVAIKVLHEALAAAVGAERFLAEIRVTASLQHPHILPLFDSGSGDGLLWYVMPFVEGETLRARLARDGRLPLEESIRLVHEIADALEHAHRRGVVHRDIKPENVLLAGATGDAGAVHAVVADFGIALALEQAGGDRLTRTGIALGTPQYMAPEQAAGSRAIDGRADIYALGAVLHEMLVGESPAAATYQNGRVRGVHEPVVQITPRRPDVPSSIDDAVRRALAVRPEERFDSAVSFAAALALPADAADLPPGDSATRTPNVGREVVVTPPPPARGRMVTARAAAYASLAMLVVGLVGGWLLARSSLASRWAAPSSVPTAGAPPVRTEQWPAATGDIELAVVDRSGRAQRTIPANRPWTPRFSPDGRRVAYGAYGAGRSSSDVWVTDLGSGTTQRLTDDASDSNDPQWSPNGSMIAYSVSAPGGKDVFVQRAGGGQARVLATRDGEQFPNDWLRDGSALLVTEGASDNGYDIVVQPADGSAARVYLGTPANETAARISPDGHWIAYTSDKSGRAEVYIDSYPQPGKEIGVSLGAGVHPVWRGDGRELYYWQNGALMAAQLESGWGDKPPSVVARTRLFAASYQEAINTMYDVSPDGQRFVIVGRR
jgi:serine/threonine-protein kinase